MASDPMAMRRGGKKLKMEDVCFYQWPLPGLDQVFFFLKNKINNSNILGRHSLDKKCLK